MFFYCHLNVDCRGCRGFGLVIASPILVLSRKRRQAQEASAVMCICHLTLMIAAPCHSTLSPLFRTRVASKLFPDVFGCSVLERSCLRMQFSLSENSGCYLIYCRLFSKGSRTCKKQSGYIQIHRCFSLIFEAGKVKHFAGTSGVAYSIHLGMSWIHSNGRWHLLRRALASMSAEVQPDPTLIW